jgi:adenylate cyclase
MTTERAKRKLSAILSADVKGYSRLMGEDELTTVETLKKYREVMTTLIQQYRGRVVDFPGDNLLAEFGSVVDAVEGAVKIQQELKNRNAELPEDRRMAFRIGVNLGDVIEEEDRIYGDGVNVAARLEALADPGGICISKTAFDQIETKLPLGYEYLGEQKVKNIAKPVGAYRVLMEPRVTVAVAGEEKKAWPVRRKAILAGALAVLVLAIAVAIWNYYFRPTTPSVEPASEERMAFPLPERPSIAVLPFVNMSEDPKQEFLSDGLTEEIITALSKVRNMFVIARNSTFTYKGKPVKIQQVAEELGVRYVLEGSVRRSEDRLRITAQLIDAVTGHHLWAERYDRELKDLFALQDEITMKILTALQVELTLGEDARMGSKGTSNLEAYLKLLQARELAGRYNKEDHVRAQQLIEEAIAVDPQYAGAYRFLGATYVMEQVMGWSKSPEQSLERALEMAQKALALDASFAEAYALVGRIHLARGEYEKAIAKGEQAYALDSNSSHVLAALAYSLQYAGRAEEAIEFYEKAIRLDPIPPSWFLFGLGRSYCDAARYEEAIVAYKKLLDRTPNDLWAHIGLTATYSLAGREEEARAAAAEALKIDSKLSVECFRTWPYKDQAYVDRLIDALRKAGIPE